MSRGTSQVHRNAYFLALLLGVIAPFAHAASLPINTELVQKSIVFLYYPGSSQGNYEVGTGFFVEIPLKNDPAHVHWAIVTARHVVDPQWAGCSWPNPQAITVRVNTTGYRPGKNEIGVWQKTIHLVVNETWFAPADDRIDIAVIPIQDPNELRTGNDVLPLKLSDFATQQEIIKFKIGIGDGIISAGLVPELLDAKRNYPAFKFGKISSVPDEAMEMRCERSASSPPKDRVIWIIAGNFVGGNSGSPVFLLPLDFTLGGGLQYNGPRTMLLGVEAGVIEGADLAEMVPVESVFNVIERIYPDGDLYRGDVKDKPKEGVAAASPH